MNRDLPPNIKNFDPKTVWSYLDSGFKAIFILGVNSAISSESAIELPKEIIDENFELSIDRVYKKTSRNKYFLTEWGSSLFDSEKEFIGEILFNNKTMKEVYEEEANYLRKEDVGSVHFIYKK